METQKLVALTFDDGPSNITEKVLDILEENNIVGTFFLIGKQVTPDKKATMERQLALGCEIANHSFTHSDMSKLSAEEIREEINKTSAVIRETVNVETRFFRPPFISLSDTMYDTIELSFICGLDSRDWDPATTAQDRIDRVLENACDGAIFLMHDLESNQNTLDALPEIIRGLKDKGYGFATVTQIFAAKGINPDVKHKMWSTVFD